MRISAHHSNTLYTTAAVIMSSFKHLNMCALTHTVPRHTYNSMSASMFLATISTCRSILHTKLPVCSAVHTVFAYFILPCGLRMKEPHQEMTLSSRICYWTICWKNGCPSRGLRVSPSIHRATVWGVFWTQQTLHAYGPRTDTLTHKNKSFLKNLVKSWHPSIIKNFGRYRSINEFKTSLSYMRLCL